ncbi:hypothetical protein L228DRAFT_246514 [Xylona heveae TC161]|uniref:Uncharacterized protein n=1 Tax=Xylona heveae (strain CBS 132557 / TC161) TaxID=1328760 RepID=A0A165HL31_XYLHT|nr:hypothetical protein L228DRAFT_246514 [Xylona heveae TC161]KZF23676.1 hypothetical protein L228DRAFT_246514 [Xylona heveae TC161]
MNLSCAWIAVHLEILCSRSAAGLDSLLPQRYFMNGSPSGLHLGFQNNGSRGRQEILGITGEMIDLRAYSFSLFIFAQNFLDMVATLAGRIILASTRKLFESRRRDDKPYDHFHSS